MGELKTELLYQVDVDLDKPRGIGATPHGNRQIYYIRGGSLEGPKIKGEVLPEGGDWLLIRPDGVAELNVRATVRTDDGHLILLDYRGLISASPEVWQRLLDSKPVDPSEYYLRTTPYFETSSEKYGWLNRIVTVGIGRLTPNGVAFTVYAIL